jgi:hypothetical protein
MTRGFLYVSFGCKYVAEARLSAASVRASNPDARICMITDLALEPDNLFDIVLPITSPLGLEKYAPKDSGAYYRKIAQIGRTPFDRTIYLDSDTFVTGSLSEMFDLLEHYDILIAPDSSAEANFGFEQTEAPFATVPKAFGVFNTGVLAYRQSGPTMQMLQAWEKNHDSYARQHTTNDQPAFRLSLYESTVRYHVLPVTYNWLSWLPCFLPGGGRVMVMHGRNPWLFKWAGHFTTALPTVVGIPSLRLLAVVTAARTLYWLHRKGWLARPKF